ncbi:MAG: hypothetical protein GC165_06815 [Armatimonadetes bacterium]|nr:hypothetical protein [Armatimonadota bacterium]
MVNLHIDRIVVHADGNVSPLELRRRVEEALKKELATRGLDGQDQPSRAESSRVVSVDRRLSLADAISAACLEVVDGR